MEYEIVAEAYRDLEQATGRLALIERLAALVAQTPAPLLPVVCYLCQGLIAPEFAGVDLGLAEKLAIRAVGTATGTAPEVVAARVREIGDLGQTAELLLAETAAATGLAETTAERATGLAARGGPAETAAGTADRGDGGEHAAADRQRRGDGVAGAQAGAAGRDAGPGHAAGGPVPAAAGHRRAAAGHRDAHHPGRAGPGLRRGRAARPVLERAYNICCDLGLVAAVLVTDGLAGVEEIQVRPGNPVRVMLAQRLADATEILAKLGGECAAEYKYDGMRLQAHKTADGRIELWTRRLEQVSEQFPDVVEVLAAGLGPAEAIIEGEVVAFDAATDELHPFAEVMFRRRKYGIAEAVRDVPVGLFCFELLYADGRDLTRLPYPQRRAALAQAITISPRLRLTTATEVTDPAALDAAFEQAITDGCEGLMCKSVGPASVYQAGNRGWNWIKLKRDYRTELSDTVDLVIVGAFAGRGRRAACTARCCWPPTTRTRSCTGR